MTSRDFCYWLQGLFELGNPTALDATQTDLIKRRLAMAFVHEIDPSAGPPAEQAKLNELHEGAKPPERPPMKIGGHGVGPHGEPILYRC